MHENLIPWLLNHHRNSWEKEIKHWKFNHILPHALLFTGIAGIGKRTLARFFAQWIHCQKQGFTTSDSAEEPCGQCPSCQKHRTHQNVDVLEISGEDSLKIEKFRARQSQISFPAYEHRFKIVFIFNAQRMTPQASHAILKLLEEPPANWVFLLTCDHLAKLLPTVISRCHMLRFKPFTEHYLREMLSDVAQPGLAAKMAQGSYTRACHWASLGEQSLLFFRFLKEPKRYFSEILDFSLQTKSQGERLIEFLTSILVELLHGSLDPTYDFAWAEPPLAHLMQDIVRSAQKRSSNPQAFWFKQVEILEQIPRGSYNTKIVLQNLLLPWLQQH